MTLRPLVGCAAAVALLVTGGGCVSGRVGIRGDPAPVALAAPAPTPVPVIRLTWGAVWWEPGLTTEIWGTTNFLNWYLVTNAVAPPVAIPCTKPWEFFKARNKVIQGTNVIFSDWGRKTTL